MSQPARPGRFPRVLEELGASICSGALPPGQAITLDQLEVQMRASRTVVREAVRSLATMGLVETRQRVGVRVLPLEFWNLFDSQVIRWRLAGQDREQQVRMLREIRLAIEPEAARLAARHTGPGLARALEQAARHMLSMSGHGPDRAETFAAADDAFHRLVLQGSGNAMFVQLADVVAAALHDRAAHVQAADDGAMHLHLKLAQQIGGGDQDAAWHTSRAIILRG
ncbi:FadR/GntR family transcriptional regulator [Bogoriella caseilytica]|uniref:DNA-binding FadR family transcriptional regulator n=1 Tax=Bogoriella caseilytica TaxID=56055 RepID=A0A3N2BEI6_9MICO|nr:FCD domain-containing protein [Bogoriella caseilytica]ROR73673.1 DNA-binding FadR family transcriptional regulator [Bogoriella caseilytica]